MLTETALRTGCLNAFTPLGSRENIGPAVLFERAGSSDRISRPANRCRVRLRRLHLGGARARRG